MAHILYTHDEKIYDPGRVVTIYDPTAGTGGMLSVSEKYILAHNPEANLELGKPKFMMDPVIILRASSN